MFKKLFLVIAAGGALCAASAQNIEGVNARIDAMGGFGVPADIGWMVDKPCALYMFPDQIQATGILRDIEGLGKTYGSAIAIKSFSKRFLIGLTLNDKRPMPSKFYSLAQEFADYNFAPMNMGKWIPNWPHLNFCIRPGDKFSLGIGTFIEQSKYDADYSKQFKYTYLEGTTPTTIKVDYDSTALRKYFGFGAVVDARIWFGSVRLNPEFKIFIPSLDGTEEVNLSDRINQSHNMTQNTYVTGYSDKAKTTDGFGNNLYFRGGAKLSGTVNGTFLIGGLWYRTDRFTLERTIETDSVVFTPNVTPAWDTTITITEQTNSYNNSSYDWWFGLQPSNLENIVYGVEYGGAVQVYTITPPEDANRKDSTFMMLKQKIRFGAEGTIPIFWNLKLHPRMGIIFWASREIFNFNNYLNDADTTTIVEKVNWPYVSNWDKDLSDSGKGAKLTGGFGLKGKRGSFDISMDILAWDKVGTITGPSAAMATLAFDFGKKE